ncbi:MAG: FKBP-type peptidyl-prolyl cis-trans isomerase [SAR324 cluster bacterium]|nr:FKBP-type peptidyl-prolyl cis-trans isomerase [SAR324 cluster bacterium]
MKKALALIFILFAAASCEQGPKRVKTLDTDLQKASYAIGVSIGSNFEKQDLEVDQAALLSGLLDSFEKKELLLDEKARQEALMNLQMQHRKQAQEKFQKQAADALEKGMMFLEENKKKAGVKVTDSGLQYKIVNAAKAVKHPKATDKVKVHYTGKLIDGTVFDSSIERGKPVEFPVNGVIPGWTEALKMMSPGEKWELVIPSNLAYGKRGAGPKIPANSVLTFEVELIEVL